MRKQCQRGCNKFAAAASHDKFCQQAPVPAPRQKIVSARSRHPLCLVDFARGCTVDGFAQVDEAVVLSPVTFHQRSHPVAHFLGLP